MKNNIFSMQVNKVLHNMYPSSEMLIVTNETPKILQDIGLKNLPITITQRHLKTIMNSKGEYKGANYHNLGIKIVKQLPEIIEKPIYIFKSNTDKNSIVLVTNIKDKKNRPIIVSIKKNGVGIINNKQILSNVLTSAYGRNNYVQFFKRNILNDNLLYSEKEGIKKRTDGKLQLRPISSSKK